VKDQNRSPPQSGTFSTTGIFGNHHHATILRAMFPWIATFATVQRLFGARLDIERYRVAAGHLRLSMRRAPIRHVLVTDAVLLST
jgi:hypothetical protein